MSTRFQIALRDIKSLFERSDRRVYGKSEMARILSENRVAWRLTQSMTVNAFTDELLKRGKLKRIDLKWPGNQTITRYAWGKISTHQLGLSLKPGAYLSHGTAVFLHGLNDQIPRTIYVNKEQSPKPQSQSSLSQEAMDKAFGRKQRISQLTVSYRHHKFVLLSGKHTDRLEVTSVDGLLGERLETTKLERTLIDIAVRPAYAGGTYQVLEAYKSAREGASVNTLISVLRKLGYKYPYHQTIGFYMSRAGFPKSRVARLRRLPMEFDFYLDYGIAAPAYDADWRLFHPKGF